MNITIDIPQLGELALAINRVAAALTGTKTLACAPPLTTAPLEPVAPVAETLKRGRGRPAKAPESAPPTEPVDYDAVLTECREMSVRMLAIDQRNKDGAYKEKQIAFFKELNPGGNAKLSGLPQDKLVEARDWFVANLPQE